MTEGEADERCRRAPTVAPTHRRRTDPTARHGARPGRPPYTSVPGQLRRLAAGSQATTRRRQRGRFPPFKRWGYWATWQRCVRLSLDPVALRSLNDFALPPCTPHSPPPEIATAANHWGHRRNPIQSPRVPVGATAAPATGPPTDTTTTHHRRPHSPLAHLLLALVNHPALATQKSSPALGL